MKKKFSEDPLNLINFITQEYKYNCKLNFLIQKYPMEKIASEIVKQIKIENSNLIDVMTFARDFYIGSDLTKTAKNKYYIELKKQKFFEELNKYLYSKKISISSYTIYTFGKFSRKENSKYLETAYLKKFKNENSILSYRALSELEWLKSKKVKKFINELKSEKSFSSKLTLIYLYEVTSNKIEIEKILKDKDFQILINPNSKSIFTSESISKKLFQFENYFFKTQKKNSNLINFEKLALKFLRKIKF